MEHLNLSREEVHCHIQTGQTYIINQLIVWLLNFNCSVKLYLHKAEIPSFISTVWVNLWHNSHGKTSHVCFALSVFLRLSLGQRGNDVQLCAMKECSQHNSPFHHGVQQQTCLEYHIHYKRPDSIVFVSKWRTQDSYDMRPKLKHLPNLSQLKANTGIMKE